MDFGVYALIFQNPYRRAYDLMHDRGYCEDAGKKNRSFSCAGYRFSVNAPDFVREIPHLQQR